MPTLPPLVAPVDALSPARATLGARTAALDGVGDLGLRRLAAARVLVVGAGGLGSPAIALLAGSGLGALGIVDPDVVDATNLARQTLFTRADVGRSKAVVAAERAASVDQELRVQAHVARFEDLTPDMLSAWDVVVDAADSVLVTRAISDACALRRIPFVWASALGFDAQVSVFHDAPADPHVDAAGNSAGVDFHDLHPDVLPDEGSCAIDGVVPALCGMVGSLMAAQVVALVTGGGSLFGRVVTIDARTWSWRESVLRRGPGSRRPDRAQDAGRPTAPTTDGGDVPAFTAPPGRITATALAARLADGTGPLVVDVRTEPERATGVIGGSVLPDAAASAARDVVVVCERGPRADRWARSLGRAGAAPGGSVAVLDGGLVAWRAAGLPLVAPAGGGGGGGVGPRG